jgi:adenylate kinase family enzyme
MDTGHMSFKGSMDRVVVIGTSCSGKTTLARSFAMVLGYPHIELDQLHWMPNWQARSILEFREEVSGAISQPFWVLDGNYSKVRDLVWTRATHLVWLNYSFPVIFGRALRRTYRRVVYQEELFGGNRETLVQVLFDRESILWWVIRTYRRRRKEYPQLFTRDEHAHLQVIELSTPVEADLFLAKLQNDMG